MLGVPGTLHKPLIAVLKRCDIFHNNDRLREFFVDDRLHPWQDELRDTARNSPERAGHVIDLLLKHYSQPYRKNALVLFLDVLAENYPNGDERRVLLTTFANELSAHIKRTSAPLSVLSDTHSRSSPKLYIEDAERMLECAHSVAKVELQVYRNKQNIGLYRGTGWLIAPLLLITCWHVVAGKTSLSEAPIEEEDLQRQVAEMRCIFGYTRVGNGVSYTVDRLLYPRNEDNAFLDYALLRLKDDPEHRLDTYDYLHLHNGEPLEVGNMLYIIQHPLGQPQMVDGNTFEHLSDHPGRICYHTRTAEGTSGAPVLNLFNWRVIGLHHGGYEQKELREGILMDSILTELQSKEPELYTEIMEAQKMLPSVEREREARADAQPETIPVSLVTQGVPPLEMKTDPPAQEQKSMGGDRHNKAGDERNAIVQQPYLQKVKKYQADFSPKLKTLRIVQKPFALPVWPWSDRRTAYPDQGKKVMEVLDALDNLMQECDRFFEKQLPRTRFMILLDNIHSFQTLLDGLRRDLVPFCEGKQAASSELQENIYQQIENCRKSGDKIKSNLRRLLI